jgi:undecaprenyl-diphosphatase
MSPLQALILSIVEGVTEFLPVSSTGHLVLASNLLLVPQTDFVKSFEIFIQLGAILAVVWLYRKKMLDIKSWKLVLPAFIPTAVLGLIFYHFIKTYLLGNTQVTLAALFLGGLILILLDKIPHKKSGPLDTKTAVLIGLAQSVSMIPGVSRSAATIVGATLLGIDKKEAVEFSFLLAVPTLAAATGLDLIKSNFAFDSAQWLLLVVGFAGAFITALLAIKFFIKYVQTHDFKAFGIYRIALALLYGLAILRA